MIKASEAKELFNNSNLIKFLDEVGDKAVQEACRKSKNCTSFSIYDAPTLLNRKATARAAYNYYVSLGYSADFSADYHTIYLSW